MIMVSHFTFNICFSYYRKKHVHYYNYKQNAKHIPKYLTKKIISSFQII